MEKGEEFTLTTVPKDELEDAIRAAEKYGYVKVTLLLDTQNTRH